MIRKELQFYFKKYKILMLILYVQLTLFFTFVGGFVCFMQQLQNENHRMHKMYAGKSIYHLLDGYYEGEKFSKFVRQPDYLHKLKSYYHNLNQTNDFAYLAIGSHHILLKDNGIPAKFLEGYEQGREKQQTKVGEDLFTAIKSFQMSQQAFSFFDLVVSEGRTWSERDFKGTGDSLPVLLGASYRGIFRIGEETTINFYFKPFTIKVIGFLKENSKVYCNQDTEFYLDEHMILPYRDYENKPISKIDKIFQKASYFAMINGYIVTDNNPASTQVMMQRVDAIAKKSSIEAYSFIGGNRHFLKYRALLTVLQQNTWLVQTVFLSITLLHFFILIILFMLHQKRRLPFFAVHYINGSTKFWLVKMQWSEIASIIFPAYVTSFIVLTNIVKIGNIVTQLIMFLFCMAVSIVICLLLTSKLTLRSIIKHINIED